MTPTLFHRAALACVAAMLALIWVWMLWWAPYRHGLMIATLATVFLLPALPGLIRGKLYTHAWSTLLSTGYMLFAAVEYASAEPARAPALLTLCCAAGWFVCSSLFVRGESRRQRLSQ